ncbi:MAG: hypothetical protein UEE41_00155 [Acutalibacteraceae bacterium]|nr:hypothetical protein [Acutalibacteraceae bacterium]
MKSKFMILLASILAISTIGLAGCARDGNATSSTDTNSAEVSETASEVAGIASTEDTVASTASNNEPRGEIINGIFTSTDGIYQIAVPEGVTLLTAADTTTVFTANEGNTTITISSEVNNGPYQDLKQETFETIYSQLYTEYATTSYEAKIVNEQQTNYRLSFTGKNKETPLQVDVLKAMTNQRAITIQVSSPQDNQPDSTMIDDMIQSLKF